VAPLTGASTRTPRVRAPGARRPHTTLRDAIGLLLLAGFVAVTYGDALRFPFLNDDYVFLDRVRTAGFGSLWGLHSLPFGYYRPFSREFHYWLLQHLAGASEPIAHLVSLVLGVAVLAAFGSLVRRAAGHAASAWALAAAAAIAAWAVPMLWVAGAQGLWMLFWAIVALRAWAGDRRGWAAAFFVLALLSKETACVLPGVMLAWDLAIARRAGRDALGRIAPLALVVLAWAAVHPQLGGRWWLHGAAPAAPAAAELAMTAPRVLLRSLGLAFNLDAPVHPDVSGAAVARAAALPVALLVLLVLVRWPRRATLDEPAEPLAVTLTGACWAVLGWMPLLLPGLGWHSYYALFGALGMLFALSPWIGRSRMLAMLLVGAVATLGVARALTPSLDWGEASYERRAADELAGLRADLLHLHPSLPRHSRLWFAGVPDRVGFMAGDGPSLRTWYRDSTLRGGFYSGYRPRGSGEPAGADYFFFLDTLRGWVEVHEGDEDAARAREVDPNWEENQRRLATALSGGGDWLRAAQCYEKLATVHPDDPVSAFRAAICRSQAGDSVAAGRWLARAASLPGASAEIRETARKAGLLPGH
jgi:hypothetical protein